VSDKLEPFAGGTIERPGVTDAPPSVRRGFNPPIIGPDDTPAEIAHKRGVEAQLARDAADAEAAAAKQAALRESLHRLFSGLPAAAAEYVESRIRGACHDRRDFENVIGVLRELGFPR